MCRPAAGNADITADGGFVRRHAVPAVCSTQSDLWQRNVTANRALIRLLVRSHLSAGTLWAVPHLFEHGV